MISLLDPKTDAGEHIALHGLLNGVEVTIPHSFELVRRGMLRPIHSFEACLTRDGWTNALLHRHLSLVRFTLN
jgi:hypothetical protein